MTRISGNMITFRSKLTVDGESLEGAARGRRFSATSGIVKRRIAPCYDHPRYPRQPVILLEHTYSKSCSYRQRMGGDSNPWC